MTICCQCGREIKTCCDIFYPVDYNGKTDDVICGECAGELETNGAGKVVDEVFVIDTEKVEKC